jgi:hypothetical protein
MNWSFIIITDGNSPFIETIIESIKIQNIKNYEIIFITENKSFTCSMGHIEYINTIKNSHITYKKNIGAKISKFENLCFLHDYISLENNWYKSFEHFGYNWDVCTTKAVNIDGSRWWDWCTIYHPEYGHANINYEANVTEWHYIPGNFFCVKREFMLDNLLNEDLCHNDGEDVEWSKRIIKKCVYKFNIFTNINFLKIKPHLQADQQKYF